MNMIRKIMMMLPYMVKIHMHPILQKIKKQKDTQTVRDPHEENDGEIDVPTDDTVDDYNLHGNIRPSGTVKSGNIISHFLRLFEKQIFTNITIFI